MRSCQEKMRDDYNISVSAPLGYNNTYAMSVRPEIAEQYQLETLTDLMAVAPELRLGCTADFTQREDALPRLESTFHTKFGEVNALDVAVRYTAIDSGQVVVIDAFATDALLSKFDLVQLEDDAQLLPALLRGQLYPSGVSGRVPRAEGGARPAGRSHLQ